jgi:predicted permease
MIRNFERLRALDLGYTRDVATLTVPLEGTMNYDDPQSRIQLVSRVEEELEALPGVQQAGVTCIFPSNRGNFLAAIEIAGRPVEPNQSLIINHRLVSPGFLPALGVPLLQGRQFTEADREGSQPVAIISDALAKKYFPGEDPIGKRLRSQRAGTDTPWLTIVGVVGDVKEFYDVTETWYLPYAQNADGRFANQLVFTVRTSLADITEGLRQAVWAVDPNLPVFGAATVEEMYADSLSEQRLGSLMVLFFATFGLLMAALGIYGVMSYAVNERTREIGIGMALGAEPGQIFRSILRRGAKLALAGVGIGLVGAIALTRFLSSLLTEVEPTDPAVFASVSLLLVLVTMAACFVPAHRATKVDPIVALRSEYAGVAQYWRTRFVCAKL